MVIPEAFKPTKSTINITDKIHTEDEDPMTDTFVFSQIYFSSFWYRFLGHDSKHSPSYE